MISAVQAFESAHQAITGKTCYEGRCGVAIERADGVYTVTFSDAPAGAGAPALAEPTVVMVDAVSGNIRDIRNARNPRVAGQSANVLSARRALEIALGVLRESGVLYDERWTTTIVSLPDRYHVIFPLPEADRTAELHSDYALLVAVDNRSGKVLEVLGAA